MAGKNIEAIYRLSPLQEGILFHTLERPGSGVYFEQFSATLDGDMDNGVMQRAWQTVVNRHSVLRTLFTWENRDKPLQIVRQRVAIPFEALDWSADDEAQRARRLESWLRLDRDRGFDLDKAPLIRITLIRIGPAQHRLIFSFHHLLIDGWSMRLIFQEVLTSYEAFAAGDELRLPPAPAFADFISWLEQRDTHGEKDYWHDMLAGYATPVCPEFGPAERDAHTPGTPNGVCEVTLESALSARLRDTARTNRLTLNTLVVGAWALLLSRYCGRDDVVFGTTVAGRPPELPDVERAAGLFINTLPLRVEIDPNATLLEFLRNVQRRQIGMREWEQTPLVTAQRASDVAPGTPLFESIVVFESFPVQEDDAAPRALLVKDEDYVEYSHFPLALLAVPEDPFRLLAVHDSRRFGQAMVARMLAHMVNLLDTICTSADALVADVSMLPLAERQQLLHEWNATDKTLGPRVPVQQLFENHARHNPEAPALYDGKNEINYGDLNERANRLAHFLVAQGTGADQAVVIYAERGTQAITGILAALKAGAAYVPMDANYPADRLQQILDDLSQSGAPLVLTQSHLIDRLPSDKARIFSLDVDVSAQSADNPSGDSDLDRLAYIIYTSGSTGRPKGVMVSHDNLLNSTRARDEYYGHAPQSWLLLSSLATDSSIAGVFWTLCSGASLVLPAGRAEQDIEKLCQLIELRKVSHTLCVPSLYSLILENAQTEALGSLRVVIVAGEACPAALVERHHRTLAHAELHNEYGPSEATVWASAAKLDAGSAMSGITIGKPVANVRLYVLDHAMQLLPVGVDGELYIGGANVARGYLHRPQQTAEAFVADPFNDTPDAKLYKTGDRVRWRGDGQLEFVGRVDDQIKVRGFRVEPGEIETTISRHPQVNEAVVFIDRGNDEAIAAALAALDPYDAKRLLDEIEGLGDEDALRMSRDINPETNA